MVMAPMLSRLCDPDGVVSPRLIDYYSERARGGAGLIIVEYCYIDEKESKANQGQLGAYSDQLIAGLGDLAEAIQEWGARAVLQICHGGRCTSQRFMGRQPIAPSAMPSYTGEMAREMTLDEIDGVMNSFAAAARRARTAGFDGVELHGTHGYLLAQFLSPYTNRRTDVYGQDRGLFALKTLDRVRAKVGPDFMVGYRLAGEEFIPGGLTLPEAQAFARRLETRGIDYIHVSGGIIEVGEHFVIPMYIPQGHLLHLAQGIKEAVKVPIMAVGAVHDPSLAEETLRENKADLIVLGRALIADPELPRKVQSGRPEDIRTCLRCNEGCSGRVATGKSQRCAVNYEVGRERALRIHPASKPKKVLVIGGGPAGMEAARVLAERKHRITLVEKEEELGGLLRYASVPDFKQELRDFLRYMRTQIAKSGIEVLTGQEAGVDFVKELQPDAVVLASGSVMPTPTIPGADNLFAARALDLLSGKFQPGDRVVIAGGAAMGCEIAAHLAKTGKKVTVVEMLNGLALDLLNRSRAALLGLLQERGVETLTGWKLEQIKDGGVLLAGCNWTQKYLPTDSVILALGMVPDQKLADPLRKIVPEVHLIGDCLEPRKIYQAIHEGSFLGRLI